MKKHIQLRMQHQLDHEASMKEIVEFIAKFPPGSVRILSVNLVVPVAEDNEAFEKSRQ